VNLRQRAAQHPERDGRSGVALEIGVAFADVAAAARSWRASRMEFWASSRGRGL
jgi:hypothetical protein